MPTKPKDRSGLLWLALLPILSILIDYYLKNAAEWRYAAVCLPWLVTGAVFKSVAGEDLPEDAKSAAGRLLAGMALLMVLWYLPAWLPFLRSSDYGMALNLRESPVVVWMGAAFVLGFYRKLITKSFAVLGNGIKNYFIQKTGLELPEDETLKFAEVWKGLQSLFKDLTRRS